MIIGKVKILNTVNTVFERGEYLLRICEITGQGYFAGDEGEQHMLSDLEHDGIAYKVIRDRVDIVKTYGQACQIALYMLENGETATRCNETIELATSAGFNSANRADFKALCETYVRIWKNRK